MGKLTKTFRISTVWLLLAVALILSGCSGSDTPEPASDRPPNIILIMTDDQGWAQVGFRGNDVIQTPNLDRLASESVNLTRFYVSPVCAPTRASLMTGRYNYRTGVVDTYIGRAMMHSDEVTVAEMLGEAGYKTGIFGKWHLGDNYSLRAIDQGFQEALVHKGGGIGQPSDPPGTSYFDPILQLNGEQKPYGGYCTDIFFNTAMMFIEQNRDNPFFVYIPTNAPHSPYDVPESYVEPYSAQGLNDKDARIYGMIANIDENIGKLLELLQKRGLAENTIVVFMTDNGPTTRRYTAGLRARKGSVYEGGIRVPFLIRWPARLAPRSDDRIAAHIDVLPTLIEAAGASLPGDRKIDGLSLLPRLLDPGAPVEERTLHIQSHRGNEPQLYRAFAAVTQKYKLVQAKHFGQAMPEDAPLELYDLVADGGEENDLAAQQTEVIEAMKSGYEEWFKDVSSTRGYDPPRILLGTEHENPVILTRQDWRVVGRDGYGDNNLGFWEVDVASPGDYEVRLLFPKQQTAGRIEFALRDHQGEAEFDTGTESVTFGPFAFSAGPAALEARLIRAGETVGVKYADVTKLD
jgi:arylsulfatase A-like enzyme